MKKRIAVLLTVVALMMLMLAMSVAPAFARYLGTGDCIRYWSQFYSHQYAARYYCGP